MKKSISINKIVLEKIQRISFEEKILQRDIINNVLKEFYNQKNIQENIHTLSYTGDKAPTTLLLDDDFHDLLKKHSEYKKISINKLIESALTIKFFNSPLLHKL